jgi:hypothetical protein
VGKPIVVAISAAVTFRKAVSKQIAIAVTLATHIRGLSSRIGRAVRSILIFWH